LRRILGTGNRIPPPADYPRFSHLVLIVIRSTHQQCAEFSAQTLHRCLKDALPADVALSEPARAP